jgi:hypothetical protein
MRRDFRRCDLGKDSRSETAAEYPGLMRRQGSPRSYFVPSVLRVNTVDECGHSLGCTKREGCTQSDSCRASARDEPIVRGPRFVASSGDDLSGVYTLLLHKADASEGRVGLKSGPEVREYCSTAFRWHQVGIIVAGLGAFTTALHTVSSADY